MRNIISHPRDSASAAPPTKELATQAMRNGATNLLHHWLQKGVWLLVCLLFRSKIMLRGLIGSE